METALGLKHRAQAVTWVKASPMSDTILIERTSKPLKLQKGLATTTYIIGALAVLGGAFGPGLLLIVGGLIWKWVTDIRIYWNHS